MSHVVLADAQFGIARILRPYAGFEADYAGQPVSRPIMCTQVISGTGGEPRDQLALEQAHGYDPRLVRGLPVPLGSRVLLMVPKIPANTTERYIWTIAWRLRNTHDFRVARMPYSFPKQGLGVPDGASDRFIIPAADQATIYNAPTPLGTLDRVVQTVRTEDVSFGSTNLFRPDLPNAVTAGTWQQGLLNPALVSDANLPYVPSYQYHEVYAVGNEIIIGAYRTADVGAAWDFTQPPFPGPDAVFAQLLGNANGSADPYPSIGVYVIVGSAP
jgi:hypothetical protein